MTSVWEGLGGKMRNWVDSRLHPLIKMYDSDLAFAQLVPICLVLNSHYHDYIEYSRRMAFGSPLLAANSFNGTDTNSETYYTHNNYDDI